MTNDSTNLLADLGIGAALGALGASQGIALPGMVLVSFGYDATIATVHAIDNSWFPQGENLTLSDVLITAAGTALGWLAVHVIFPPNQTRENPPVLGNVQIPVVAAGLAAMALPGRVPGRLRMANYARHATYRGSR